MTLDLSFLSGIRYSQITLEFAVERTIRVPGFAGSSFRGALGDVLRPALCSHRPACETCAEPDICRYFSLFERSRDPSGHNLPKAIILEPPVLDGLDRIAHGAPPEPPFITAPPVRRGAATQLINEEESQLPPGCRVPLLVTFLGPVTALAPSFIEALARQPFPAMSGVLRLARAYDASTAGRSLYDENQPLYALQTPSVRDLDSGESQPFSGVVRVVLTTPTRVVTKPHPNTRVLCLEPRIFMDAFLRRALVHVKQVYDAFGPPGRTFLPFMEPPANAPRPAGYRLYHYRYPRFSNRQDAWIEFDGLLGYFDLEGDWPGGLIRLLRAVEVLHVAQKATSGLGRVRCYPLSPERGRCAI